MGDARFINQVSGVRVGLDEHCPISYEKSRPGNCQSGSVSSIRNVVLPWPLIAPGRGSRNSCSFHERYIRYWMYHDTCICETNVELRG